MQIILYKLPKPTIVILPPPIGDAVTQNTIYTVTTPPVSAEFDKVSSVEWHIIDNETKEIVYRSGPDVSYALDLTNTALSIDKDYLLYVKYIGMYVDSPYEQSLIRITESEIVLGVS